VVDPALIQDSRVKVMKIANLFDSIHAKFIRITEYRATANASSSHK
jgi:hypothetical protein